LTELETEIKQLLEVEEMIRLLRQKKESELRRQLLEGARAQLTQGSSVKISPFIYWLSYRQTVPVTEYSF